VIAASAFWIIFRFIHVVSAIIWVGSAFAIFVFVEPTAAAFGPEGGRFMGSMVERGSSRRLSPGSPLSPFWEASSFT
jgi:uncharacterized membrane protein